MSSTNLGFLRLAMQQCRNLLLSRPDVSLSRSNHYHAIHRGLRVRPLSLSLSVIQSQPQIVHDFTKASWFCSTCGPKTNNLLPVPRYGEQISRHFAEDGKARQRSDSRHSTVKSECRKWREKLEKAEVPEPQTSVEYIVAFVLGEKTLHGIDVGYALTKEQLAKIDVLCQRRMQHEPVQYIIGEWDFHDIQLALRPPVFIPRSETEELVGIAAEMIQEKGKPLSEGILLEICCGSGAISLALLHKFPLLSAVAVDLSEEACALTLENARHLGLADRLTVIQGDVADKAVHDSLRELAPFDLLISNPPYIPTSQISSLETQILRYEDSRALDGGEDGLNIIREILHLSPLLLSPHSDILFEIQPGQPDQISQITSDMKQINLQFVSSMDDYLGRERFCHLRTT